MIHARRSRGARRTDTAYEHPMHLLDQLLPWNWTPLAAPARAAA
jgi:hypothetical protein